MVDGSVLTPTGTLAFSVDSRLVADALDPEIRGAILSRPGKSHIRSILPPTSPLQKLSLSWVVRPYSLSTSHDT